jgi:hypothetical protein
MAKRKRTKWQTMICKTRKLKFKQNESDLKLRVKSGAPEGLVVLLH